jgi:UDP-glucose 4-epimerase
MLSSQRILITGASGFVGRRLLYKALTNGAEVYALCRTPQARIALLHPYPSLDVSALDLNDSQTLQDIMARFQPTWVVHTAAHVNWGQDPNLAPSMYQNNTLATLSVLEAARRAGSVNRVIVLGSGGEYGRAASPCTEETLPQPVDPYSSAKLAATELALLYHRSFGLKTTVLRPFVSYGPEEAETRLFPSLFARVLRGELYFDMTAGEQLRDFVYIDDLVEAVWKAAASEGCAGEILNVGRGIPISVREAVDCALRVSQSTLRPNYGALPYRVGEPMVLWASTEKLSCFLDWQPPTSLEEGLRITWSCLLATKRRT